MQKPAIKTPSEAALHLGRQTLLPSYACCAAAFRRGITPWRDLHQDGICSMPAGWV